MCDDPAAALVNRCPYPVLNPAFVPVEVDENTVQLRAGPWSGPMKTIRDRDGDGEVAELFAALDGRTHASEVLASVPESDQPAVASLLLELVDERIVYDREQHGTDIWPHLAITPDTDHPVAISERSVLLVSVGDLGAQVANDLLSMGVTDLRVARRDATETWDRVPDDEVRVANDIDDAVDAVDFVAAVADRPSRALMRTVNERALATDTPWLAGQVLGCDGVVGPTVFPGETACYACFEDRLRSNAPNPTACERYLDASPSDGHDSHPSLKRIVAGYVGRELSHLLGYGSGYTAGRVLTIDGHSLSFAANDVLKVPRCDCCGPDHGADHQRFLTMDDFAAAAAHETGGE